MLLHLSKVQNKINLFANVCMSLLLAFIVGLFLKSMYPQLGDDQPNDMTLFKNSQQRLSQLGTYYAPPNLAVKKKTSTHHISKANLGTMTELLKNKQVFSEQGGNLNTPFFNFMLSGFSHLALIKLERFWFILNTIAIFLACLNYFKDTLFTTPYLLRLAFTTSLFCTPAVIDTLRMGQITGLLLLLTSALYHFNLRKHNTPAAIIIGLLAALKLFFLFFWLILIWQKKWRELLIASIALLIFSSLPLVSINWSVYQDYFNLLNWKSSILYKSAFSLNASMLGFITRPQSSHYFGLLLGESRLIHLHTIGIILSLALITIYFLQIKCINVHQENRYTDLGIAACLWIAPLGWAYYFPLLIPGLLYRFESLVYHKKARYQTKTYLLIVCYACISFTIPNTYLVGLHAWYFIDTHASKFLIFFMKNINGIGLLSYLLLQYNSTIDADAAPKNIGLVCFMMLFPLFGWLSALTAWF